MACINPDGSLSAVAMLMLDYLLEPHTEQEIAQRAAQPMYRIRSSIRELKEAGMIEAADDGWQTTEDGKFLLNSL